VVRSRRTDYDRRYYPLTDEAHARADFNPGDGVVSRLCHEPGVALAVLEALVALHVAKGRLALLLERAAGERPHSSGTPEGRWNRWIRRSPPEGDADVHQDHVGFGTADVKECLAALAADAALRQIISLAPSEIAH
jgi:hypothetical protein